MEYIEKDLTKNYFDFKNGYYLRENKEFQFKIDFINNLFMYYLKDLDKLMEGSLISSSFKNANPLILKYKLDEDEKTIIIHLL